ARQRGLAGGELAFALLELRSPLLEIGAEARVALCMRQLGLEPVQLGLARSKLHLALVESGRARSRLADDSRLVGVLAFERLELVFGPGELPLAVGERLPLLLELARELRAVAVEALQLPELHLGLFVTLGGELLLPRELRLELREPRVLGLDRLALVANLALAFLELRLELGELRVALVESGRTARQALLGLGAGQIGRASCRERVEISGGVVP